MSSIIVSPNQKFAARIIAVIISAFLFKWIFFDSKPQTPPGQIAHPAFLERITLGTPLSGHLLDTRTQPFLQTRINRDEAPDVFETDILAGMTDFWTRFQKPFSNAPATKHLDEQVVLNAIEELMKFNGWAAAACPSLTRPFGLQKKDDDWSDLSSSGALYYFALVVHNADHFLLDQLAVIVQLSKRLGASSVFVSIVDYGSTDSTPFLSDLAEAIMILLGIPFRIRQVDPMTNDPAASYYPLEEAYTRNLALEPLHELADRRKIKFSKVIWLKGFTCPNDILETIRVGNENDAAMVCGMDWKEHNKFFIYSDRWRSRDMDGLLFRGSRSTSPLDEAPPRDNLGGARYTLHLPFQVFCCESGTHIVDPRQSYYEGISYQSSVEYVFNISAVMDGKTPRLSEGPCMDSAQLHFCRDLWMLAFRQGVKKEAKRIEYEIKKGKTTEVTPMMEELIQAMRSSFAPDTSGKVGYSNSGDFNKEETEEDSYEPQNEDPAPETEPDAERVTVEGEEDGEGRPIDLAVNIEDSPSDLEDVDVDADVQVPKKVAEEKEKEKEVKPMDPEEVKEAVQGQGKLGGLQQVAKQAAANKAAAEKAAAMHPNPKNEIKKEKAEAAAQKAADKEVAKAKLAAADKEAKEKHKPAAVPKQKVQNQKRQLEETFDHNLEPKEQQQQQQQTRPRSLPNSAFPNAIARILINPRCVTTYAGVSHTQLAQDLFGSGEEQEPFDSSPGSAGRKRYKLDDWRTAPESFACQEMKTTGGRVAPKQQRRTGFQQARLLLDGWRPT